MDNFDEGIIALDARRFIGNQFFAKFHLSRKTFDQNWGGKLIDNRDENFDALVRRFPFAFTFKFYIQSGDVLQRIKYK